MRPSTLLASACTVGAAAATPYGNSIWGRSGQAKSSISQRQDASNPFDGKYLAINPDWAQRLERTQDSFLARGDTASARVVQVVRQVGSFVWISNIADLANLDRIIDAARAERETTGVDQIVGLVLYNIPNRDCSSVQRPGELRGPAGLGRYKDDYITPIVQRLSAATDLTFAIVVEPDALANMITNLSIENCSKAAALYEEGIVFAISKLQFSHVHLYLDAAHGGWLGKEGNLEPGKELWLPHAY